MFISKGVNRLVRIVHEKICSDGECENLHGRWDRMTIAGINFRAYYYEHVTGDGYIGATYSVLEGPNWTVVMHAYPPYSYGDRQAMLRDLTMAKLSDELGVSDS